MHKAYKYRLYPTSEQGHKISKFIGCSRFVFNHFLDLSKNGNYTSYSANSKLLTELKKLLPWLREADKFALQNSLKTLDDAFKRFFKNKMAILSSSLRETQETVTRPISPTIILKFEMVI